MVETTIKLCEKLFFHKINKNVLHIRGYDVTHSGFKTL